MVNSKRLTVSKLSGLQKLILSKLKENDGDLPLNVLAYSIAEEYEGIHAQRLKNTEFRDSLPLGGEEKVRGALGFLYQGFQKTKDNPYLDIGEKEGWILSNRFKAAFYRSIKRLHARGLMRIYWSSCYDDITRRRIHYKCVRLVEEVVPGGVGGDLPDGAGDAEERGN